MRGIFGLILVLLFCFNTALAHGGHMATLVIDRHADGIALEFKIDNHILSHFPMEQECDHYDAAKALCIAQYLNEHIQLKINGEKVAFELGNSEQEERFFIVRMSSPLCYTDTCEVTLENRCFYEYDSSFENRVILRSYGSFANSYRFTEGYTKVTLQ